MINLPEDIVRYIFKILLFNDPLLIFSFTEKSFEIGGYTKEEKESLVIDCIEENYKRVKLPLICSGKSLHLFQTENLYKILNIIKDKNDGSDKYTKYILDFSKKTFRCNTFKKIYTIDNLKKIYEFNKKYILELNNLYEYAIIVDNLKLFEWFTSIGCKRSGNESYICIKLYYSYHYSSYDDNKWLSILTSQNPPFEITKDCFYKAFINEDLELLKFLYAKSPENMDKFCKNFNLPKNFETLLFIHSIKNKKLGNGTLE